MLVDRASLGQQRRAPAVARREKLREGLALFSVEQGPNIFLYPDGQWLSGVTPADADAVLKTLEE